MDRRGLLSSRVYMYSAERNGCSRQTEWETFEVEQDYIVCLVDVSPTIRFDLIHPCGETVRIDDHPNPRSKSINRPPRVKTSCVILIACTAHRFLPHLPLQRIPNALPTAHRHQIRPHPFRPLPDPKRRILPPHPRPNPVLQHCRRPHLLRLRLRPIRRLQP